jgi:glyoxylase-like metal-dependent hydrolase (beta-lactamase superfamily II)
MDGRSQGLRGELATHCLVIESGSELVLVDTGYGLQDMSAPERRLSRFLIRLFAPDLREEMTAVRQLEALGFTARDVRHIVLTHLDWDHAGGLDDFPEARVHMMARERDTAAAQTSWLDRQRYRPQQWASRPRWQTYELSAGEPWFGFEAVRGLAGVPPEIVMVPLVGHTLGHAGVAIRDRDHWLLFAGDAFFDRDEIDLAHPRCPPGLRLYQWMMDKDRDQRLKNQRRLRELLRDHGSEVRVTCAHDPRDFETLARRALDEPVRWVERERALGVDAQPRIVR